MLFGGFFMADLLSVGIDIGTTTTQLIFSKIKMENTTGYFAVPRISIVDKEILYQSEVHLTPLLTETLIDSDGVREIVAQECQKRKCPRGHGAAERLCR